ncbi:TPA: glycosyltransferase family 52 [Neisseria weaveri]
MNLVIAFTPLHLLIARQIMNKKPDETFHLVMASHVETEKICFYYEKFVGDYQYGSKWILSGWQNEQAAVRVCLKALPRSNYQTVLIGAIHEPFGQELIRKLHFDVLETFDDGTANLCPGSFLYKAPRRRKWQRFCHWLKGKHNVETLRKLSSKHYTLYPGLGNIAEPLEALTLWKRPSEKNKPVKETRKLFVSQPGILSTESPLAYHEMLQQLFAQYGMTACVLHPREQQQMPSEIPCIHTPLLIEDYIIGQIEQHPDVGFELYTFFSSSALHLQHIPNVGVTCFRLENRYYALPERTVDEVYQALEKSGIRQIALRFDGENITAA